MSRADEIRARNRGGLAMVSDLEYLLERNSNLESAIQAIERMADNMSRSQVFRYVAEEICDTLRVHLGE